MVKCITTPLEHKLNNEPLKQYFVILRCQLFFLPHMNSTYTPCSAYTNNAAALIMTIACLLCTPELHLQLSQSAFVLLDATVATIMINACCHTASEQIERINHRLFASLSKQVLGEECQLLRSQRID